MSRLLSRPWSIFEVSWLSEQMKKLYEFTAHVGQCLICAEKQKQVDKIILEIQKHIGEQHWILKVVHGMKMSIIVLMRNADLCKSKPQ